jgi:hypothetical protein
MHGSCSSNKFLNKNLTCAVVVVFLVALVVVFLVGRVGSVMNGQQHWPGGGCCPAGQGLPQRTSLQS